MNTLESISGEYALWKLAEMKYMPGIQLRDVWEAFDEPRVDVPGQYRTAIDVWKYSSDKHADDYDPPRGVPVLFSTVWGAGMIGLSLSGGRILLSGIPISTKIMRIREAESRYHGTYLGWTGDFMGHKVETDG